MPLFTILEALRARPDNEMLNQALANFLNLKVEFTLTNNNSEDKIPLEDIKNLLKALKYNQTIITLDLSGTHLGAAGLTVLAEILQTNRTIKSLDLRYNQIGAAEALTLARALYVNQTVTSIDLRGNKIGAIGLVSLAEFIVKNPIITSVRFGGDYVDEQEVFALAKFIRSTVFRLIEPSLLELSYDEVSKDSALALADAFVLHDKNFNEKAKYCLTQALSEVHFPQALIIFTSGYLDFSIPKQSSLKPKLNI